MSERRQNRGWLWVFVGALALVGVPALGQDIPEAIRTKTEAQLTDDEVKAVTQFVADHTKNLTGEDPLLLRKDRVALLGPLEKPDTGAPFRLTYEKALLPKITEMAGSAKELVVINGLILAGDLATNGGIAAIEGKMGAKQPAVRFQAAYALARTFQAVQSAPKAAGDDTLVRAVKGLEARIAEEKDANVLDAFIRAGLDAAKVGNLQNAAVSAVAKGVAKSAKNLNNPGGDKEAQALLRAANELQLLMGTTVGRGVAVDAPTAKDAAEMGGVLIARVGRMVEKKELPLAGADPKDTLRDTCGQVVSASQKLIQFSGQALQPGGTFPMPPLVNSLKLGTTQGDATFVQDSQLLIGPGGMLIKAPFEIPADRFK